MPLPSAKGSSCIPSCVLIVGKPFPYISGAGLTAQPLPLFPQLHPGVQLQHGAICEQHSGSLS